MRDSDRRDDLDMAVEARIATSAGYARKPRRAR